MKNINIPPMRPLDSELVIWLQERRWRVSRCIYDWRQAQEYVIGGFNTPPKLHNMPWKDTGTKHGDKKSPKQTRKQKHRDVTQTKERG